jgi:hypothetical protein
MTAFRLGDHSDLGIARAAEVVILGVHLAGAPEGPGDERWPDAAGDAARALSRRSLREIDAVVVECSKTGIRFSRPVRDVAGDLYAHGHPRAISGAFDTEGLNRPRRSAKK